MGILEKISAGSRAAKAFHAFSTGDYDRAIPLLEKQLADDDISGREEVYYQLGLSYLETGNIELAVSNLAIAFSMYESLLDDTHPASTKDEFVLAGIAYGRSLQQAGQHDQAIKTLEKVKGIQGDNACK